MLYPWRPHACPHARQRARQVGVDVLVQFLC